MSPIWKHRRCALAAVFLIFLAPIRSLAAAGPEAVRTVAPVVRTSELHGKPAEIDIRVWINAHGFVTEAVVERSTHPDLDAACLEAAAEWRFEATEAATQLLIPFRLHSDRVSLRDRDPRPIHKERPELSESLRAINGSVFVIAKIDPAGRVVEASVQESTHPELEGPVLEAVRRWRFQPALETGTAVPAKVGIPFAFAAEPAALRRMRARVEESAPEVGASDRPLEVLRRVEPTLRGADRLARGEATIEMLVDENGFVAEARIVAASAPRLGALAQAAARRWKFRPAIEAGVARAAIARQRFVFNGGEPVPADPEPVDRIAEVARRVSPVVPDALRRVGGTVDVLVTVNAEGAVVSAEVRDSTLPELERAALDAARQWRFVPARRDGEPVASRLLVPFVFGR